MRADWRRWRRLTLWNLQMMTACQIIPKTLWQCGGVSFMYPVDSTLALHPPFELVGPVRSIARHARFRLHHTSGRIRRGRRRLSIRRSVISLIAVRSAWCVPSWRLLPLGFDLTYFAAVIRVCTSIKTMTYEQHSVCEPRCAAPRPHEPLEAKQTNKQADKRADRRTSSSQA